MRPTTHLFCSNTAKIREKNLKSIRTKELIVHKCREEDRYHWFLGKKIIIIITHEHVLYNFCEDSFFLKFNKNAMSEVDTHVNSYLQKLHKGKKSQKKLQELD